MAALAMVVKEELAAVEKSKTLPPKKRLSFDASVTVAQLQAVFTSYVSFKVSKDSSHCLFIFVTACFWLTSIGSINFIFWGVYKTWGGYVRYADTAFTPSTKSVVAPAPDDRVDGQTCWPYVRHRHVVPQHEGLLDEARNSLPSAAPQWCDRKQEPQRLGSPCPYFFTFFSCDFNR